MFAIELDDGKYLRFTHPAYVGVDSLERATRFKTFDRAASFLEVSGKSGSVIEVKKF